MAGSVDRVGSHGAIVKALEVEEVSTAGLAGCALGGMFGTGLAGRVAFNAAVGVFGD